MSDPDIEHFDKMLLKELAWRLDREVWAHVKSPSPREEWSTSKARERTRELITEYIGDYDKAQSRIKELEGTNSKLLEEIEKLKSQKV
jgi:hypothetical protein